MDGDRAMGRRAALRIVAGAAAGGWLAWRLPRARRGPVRRAADLMGTRVHLTVLGERDEAAAAADATLARMAAVEAELSRFVPGSDVARLNRTGAVARPSASLRRVLALARRVHALGGGAFDVTVQPVLALYREHLASRHALPSPASLEQAVARVGQDALSADEAGVRFTRPGMALTLDGIAKGYVVDEGVAVLRGRGFGDVLVEAGGDLLASGRRAPDTRWRVGIRSPRPGGSALLARIPATDVAVATSGDSLQAFTPDRARHHIVDPRTGVSAPELACATVVAPDAALADALATLAMVARPRRTIELLEELDGCEALLVTKGSETIATSGFVTL